jgi:hypothetical protein
MQSRILPANGGNALPSGAELTRGLPPVQLIGVRATCGMTVRLPR